MQDTGIGIIGFGWFAQLIAESIAGTPHLRLVAVAETDDRRRQLLQTKIPSVRAYQTAEQLLADKDVTVVVIATPPVTHAPLGKKALAAGKHLFLEKPGALNLEDMAELRTLARTGGLRASIDFVMRRHPLYLMLKKLQDNGVFGEPERALLENYAHDDHLHPGHWFWDVTKSGGIWIEHGVHFFDLAHWLLGPVSKVWADSLTRSGETLIDRVVGTALHDNDCIVSYYHGFTKPELFEATNFNLIWERAYAGVTGWIPTELSLDALITPEVATYINSQLIPDVQAFLPGIGVKLVSINTEPLSTKQTHLKGRGKKYQATARLKLALAVTEDRWTVYRHLVRQGLLDLCTAVRNPNHQLAVTLDNAYEALKVAIAFTVNHWD